jgi:hypothetical protein
VKYLVSFNCDWADEFSAEGLAIITEEQKANLETNVGKTDWFFGTNEGWEADCGPDLTDFTFTEITDEEEATLRKLIPGLKIVITEYEYPPGTKCSYVRGGSFGQFPDQWLQSPKELQEKYDLENEEDDE